VDLQRVGVVVEEGKAAESAEVIPEGEELVVLVQFDPHAP
jgi:hypothetical protein